MSVTWLMTAPPSGESRVHPGRGPGPPGADDRAATPPGEVTIWLRSVGRVQAPVLRRAPGQLLGDHLAENVADRPGRGGGQPAPPHHHADLAPGEAPHRDRRPVVAQELRH